MRALRPDLLAVMDVLGSLRAAQKIPLLGAAVPVLVRGELREHDGGARMPLGKLGTPLREHRVRPALERLGEELRRVAVAAGPAEGNARQLIVTASRRGDARGVCPG